jgi:hypothetical protein
MKKIKNNYTNFILTVIAVAMIGILFKGEKIITSAHAVESHYHYNWEIWSFESEVENIVEYCRVSGNRIRC